MEKKKENIRNAYIRACNDYLYKLLDNWELYSEGDTNFGWWVGDDVGGVFCFEDDTFIGMDDIRYCVDNDVDYDTYLAYLEYTTNCSEYGFNTMNLNAYVKGAPRISDETFVKLGEMKQQIHDYIEETKQSLEKASSDKH